MSKNWVGLILFFGFIMLVNIGLIATERISNDRYMNEVLSRVERCESKYSDLRKEIDSRSLEASESDMAIVDELRKTNEDLEDLTNFINLRVKYKETW